MEAPSRSIQRFAIGFALIVALASVSPFVAAVLSAPEGSWYLGTTFNTDDQMVYRAWLLQAQSGAILFDNRFAVDPHPALTLNHFFLGLGLISRIIGPEASFALSRAVFGALALLMLAGLLWKWKRDETFVKLGLWLATFGGGLGFLAWHTYGQSATRPGTLLPSALTGGALPTDVWQPEGFVFPSMLVNGLFLYSLCLILATLHCVIHARQSRKAAWLGAIPMLLLMNAHSYDALLVVLILIGFAASCFGSRLISVAWVVRAATICLGAIPTGLWFLYVLSQDPVFRERAATETYSPTFRALLLGYLPLVLLAFGAFWPGAGDPPELAKLRRAGCAVLSLLFIAGFTLSPASAAGYWMGPWAWGACFALALATCYLLASGDPIQDLLSSWAVIGFAAPYFPALFQRKLAMGLSVPWALLAAWGALRLARSRPSGEGKLLATLAGAACSASCLIWLAREFAAPLANVSRTTMQPAYLESDVREIFDSLRKEGRTVTIAMPGIAAPIGPDAYAPPLIPDLNPLAAGFALSTAYAGHWSETPGYEARRRDATRVFLASTPPAVRDDVLKRSGATHLIAPIPAAFPLLEDTPLRLSDARELGRVLLQGRRFALVRLP
jgi:hypothetical protein